jgi:hypothetical protein
MIEAFILFLAGWMLTWPALIILLVLGVIFEANSAHNWSLFTGIAAATVAYFFFSIPLETLLVYSLGYFVVGFLWSFWRYKRYADFVATECVGRSLDARKNAVERLKPSRMLDKITTWVLVWPFSMVENVFSDLIKIVQTFITKFFKGIYSRIYQSAVGKIMDIHEL